MTEGIPTPVSLGFSEFIAKLISDTFDAVIVSMAEQEEKLSELMRLATSPEEFAQAAITDDEVDELLAVLFPGDETHQSLVYPGALYQPLGVETLESPPLEKLLGIDLKVRSDYIRKAGEKVFKLTSQGVEKIRVAARAKLAVNRLAALREIVRRGTPRLVVDTGRINAKLTFQVLEGETTMPTNLVEKDISSGVTLKSSPTITGTRLVSGLNLTPLQRYSGLMRPFTSSGVRLGIRPADSRDPQLGQIKVNVFSEVEVTFKTII